MLTALTRKLNHPCVRGPKALVMTIALVVLSGVVGGGVGFYIGTDSPSPEAMSRINELKQLVRSDRAEVLSAQARAEDELDALAVRLGTIQAQVMRLDAVGERLVNLAGLDKDEFLFNEELGIGGIDLGDDGQTESPVHLLAELDNFEGILKQQEYQLTLLEEVLMNRDILKDVLPSGLPVENGWISSGFGSRIHPVSGKRKPHLGVDFPGKKGTKIYAVAPGVVIKSEKVSGYGNMVEIRHAEGYTTRYAHASKLLVNEGDLVEKDQEIALMGATGVVTGTHLHFEVRKDGSPINPKQFFDENDKKKNS